VSISNGLQSMVVIFMWFFVTCVLWCFL